MCNITKQIERFVCAVEVIAQKMTGVPGATAEATDEQIFPPEVVPGKEASPVKETEAPADIEPEVGIPVAELGIGEYPTASDREAWVSMCEVRNIDIPTGTRTTTLAKKVKAWDTNNIKKDREVATSSTPPAPEPKPVVTHAPPKPTMGDLFDEEPAFTLEEFKTRAKTIRSVYLKEHPDAEEKINEAVAGLFAKFGARTPKDIPEELREECLDGITEIIETMEA